MNRCKARHFHFVESGLSLRRRSHTFTATPYNQSDVIITYNLEYLFAVSIVPCRMILKQCLTHVDRCALADELAPILLDVVRRTTS